MINDNDPVQHTKIKRCVCLFLVLPAGPVNMAWGSPAEACAAVFLGPAGFLHRSDPDLRLPAPPVRRPNGLHTGRSHRLLGGEFALTARFHASTPVLGSC